MPVELTAALQAELLTADGRMPLERLLTLAADFGLALEVRIPDGTIQGTLLAAMAGRLSALLVTSDAAVRVRVGQGTRNTDVRLEPGGVLALLGIDAPAFGPCTVTYTPGDGSVATVALLGAIEQVAPIAWTEGWDALLPPFVPVTLWTEGWETG